MPLLSQMADNLLESYNPLYDVHLRQYFASPHMQKHLRNLGLLDGEPAGKNELHAGHLQMMDMMLRNRERVLAQLMDLQRKLDAAEKVELYRRIRSGATTEEELNRSHVSRSLSRPARSAATRSGRGMGEGRRRRQSLSPEAGDLIKRVENDYRSDSAPFKNPKSIYNRLAANVYKYQYLHKLDDRTLHKYMNSLRKQLAKLERFREISFGPHTMAKHQPSHLQQSWFFRRRSLPSLDASANHNHHNPQPQANAGRRSAKSGLGRKSRSGKSQSPLRYNAHDEPPNKMQRTSVSRTRGTQRLPPLPSAQNSKKQRPIGVPRTNTAPTVKEHRLPPTAVIRPTRKVQEPQRRPPTIPTASKVSAGKKTPVGSRPVSQKGSITPVPVQKPPSAGSGVLPAIGTALAGAAVGAGIAAAAAHVAGEEVRKEEENNRESGAPSPSISLAASQTTTTDGGQPGVDSEWEGEQNAAEEEMNGGTETKPTPEPEAFGEEERYKNEEESGGNLTARPSIHSQVQSPEEEQPPEEPEPPKEDLREEVQEAGYEEVEHGLSPMEHPEQVEYEQNQVEDQPEEPDHIDHGGEVHFEEERPQTNAEAETYPDEIQSLDKGVSPEEAIPIEEEHFTVQQQEQEETHPEFQEKQTNFENEMEEEANTGRSKREVQFEHDEAFTQEQPDEDNDKQEWTPQAEEIEAAKNFDEEMKAEDAASLNAAESDLIRRYSHPNPEMETGPEESVRSLASSSVEDSLQKEEALSINQQESDETKVDEEEAKYQERQEMSPTAEEEKLLEEAEQQEEKEFEEIEKEVEALKEDGTEHIQTPVQIEITPSPENTNWDAEEQEEEFVIPAKMEAEESDLKDLNGNELKEAEDIEKQEGNEEANENRHSSGFEDEDHQVSNYAESQPLEQTEFSHIEEADDKNFTKEGKSPELPQELEENKQEIHSENTHDQHDQFEDQLIDAHVETGIPQNDSEFGELHSPIANEAQLETGPISPEHAEEDEKQSEKIEDQQNADLVESESVFADEKGTGRKLSGADAQLELEDASKFGEQTEHTEQSVAHEFGQNLEQEDEGLVESGALKEEHDASPVEPYEAVNLDENTGSAPIVEDDAESPMGIETSQNDQEDVQILENQPIEDPGRLPDEESLNYFGKPSWSPREAEEDPIERHEDQLEQHGEVDESHAEQKHENQEVPQEKVHEIQDDAQLVETSAKPIDDVRINTPSEDGDRPATADAVVGGKTLLSQPSIEITPASEYGGSMEDNRDIHSIASQPNSPMLKEEDEVGTAEHHEPNANQEDKPLIDFGSSSSPIAQNFGESDKNEIEETGHEPLIESATIEEAHHHQNGQMENISNQEEETHNKADEKTSLLSNDSPKTNHGNGHLISGIGTKGEGESSSDTEGADEKGSDEEDAGSVIIHGATTHSEHQQEHQHFQSVKLEDDQPGHNEA